MHRRSVLLTIGLLVAVTSGFTAIPAASAVPAATVPGTTCPAFPADNVWNTRVDTLPVHAKNDAWLWAMSSQTVKLHPDYGPAGAGQQPYGIPWQLVAPTTKLVAPKFQWPSESNPGGYPLTASTRIEGGSDRHAIMVNPSTCILYELFNAHYAGTKSTAGSGARWNLASNGLRTAGWTSADAAGLPILPLLVDYDQVSTGALNHAIRVTAQCTTKSYLWPARHQAGVNNSNCPPMGARFRLKSTFTLPSNTCSARCQTVVTTMKRYGLIVADNGSNWFFTGTSDTRWSGSEVNQLKQIPASQFQAVDETCLRISANSAKAYQPGSARYIARCT